MSRDTHLKGTILTGKKPDFTQKIKVRVRQFFWVEHSLPCPFFGNVFVTRVVGNAVITLLDLAQLQNSLFTETMRMSIHEI